MQPSANDVGTWVLVAVMLLSAGASLTVMFNARRTQKREVTLNQEVATKEELATLRATVESREAYAADRRKAIYSMIDENRKHTDCKIDEFRREVKEDVGALHDKINLVSQEVSAVAKNCELTNQSVNGITSQIMRIVERSK
jgi:Asp-tRNA(Asn)/Glu-tRNA(Gln) amidotransferase B subunit